MLKKKIQLWQQIFDICVQSSVKPGTEFLVVGKLQQSSVKGSPVCSNSYLRDGEVVYSRNRKRSGLALRDGSSSAIRIV